MILKNNLHSSFLFQFVECIGLNQKPFHLVGISVGGMVAGLYAAQYPAEVCSLSLLCPAGKSFKFIGIKYWAGHSSKAQPSCE